MLPEKSAKTHFEWGFHDVHCGSNNGTHPLQLKNTSINHANAPETMSGVRVIGQSGLDCFTSILKPIPQDAPNRTSK
jgi:hypothetical protein